MFYSDDLHASVLPNPVAIAEFILILSSAHKQAGRIFRVNSTSLANFISAMSLYLEFLCIEFFISCE